MEKIGTMNRITEAQLATLQKEWERVTGENLTNIRVLDVESQLNPWVAVHTTELAALRLFHYYRNSFLRDRTSIDACPLAVGDQWDFQFQFRNWR